MKEGNQKEKIFSIGFLRKQLNEADSEAFRNRLKEADFQEQVSEEVVQQYGRHQLKAKLEDIHQRVEVENKQRRRLRVFLALALISLLSYVCWQSFSPSNHSAPQPTELFADYFTPYPSVFDQKGAAPTGAEDLLTAMEAYTAQDYPKAIQLFEAQINQDENSFQRFYYGIALLADQQVGKAVNELEALQQNSSSPLPEDPLTWYLALAYLGENNTAAAQSLLKELAVGKSSKFKQQEAAELLKLL